MKADTTNAHTLIKVYLNGDKLEYVFEGNIKDRFRNHIRAVGFFIGEDVDGKTVTITPENCGTIEIIEQGGIK